MLSTNVFDRVSGVTNVFDRVSGVLQGIRD